MTLHDARTGIRTGTVPLPGRGTITSLTARQNPGHELWFAYTDHATPTVVLHYDAAAGRLSPWPGHSPATAPVEGVNVTQEVLRSRDGTEVRMFVMSPTGHPDRPRPAVLTGYGGFGASMTPGFTPQAVPWVRAGGVYAVACVRGGGEEGEEWHRAGRREHKHNTFDDFDAAADHLLRDGWAAPGRLGVLGSSNGGLLAAAALTRRPETYAAVVCAAPLLDMVRYELSGMGASWRDEYGSAADPAQFARLLSYSPYHQVREGARYPAVLLAVFDGDTRVDPAHARKMCAALQWAQAPVTRRSCCAPSTASDTARVPPRAAPASTRTSWPSSLTIWAFHCRGTADMNVLLCPLNDPGYLYPALAVGRELRRRAHTVHVLAGPRAAPAGDRGGPGGVRRHRRHSRVGDALDGPRPRAVHRGGAGGAAVAARRPGHLRALPRRARGRRGRLACRSWCSD